MKKTLLFWESNTTGSGAEFLRATLTLGWQPHLLCADPSLYTDVPAETAITRLDSSADELQVEALLRQIAPHGILTTSNHFVTQAARFARRLGLAGPEPDAIDRCIDKYHQRTHLLDAGIPQPEFCYCRNEVEAVAAAAGLGYPVIVKPLSGSGKVGVSLAEDESRLRSWCRPLLNTATNERGQAVPPGILVEAYFAGREFSIECFHGSPVAVCEKQCSPPHFVEANHVTPPIDLHDRSLASLQQLAGDALRALGLTWGAAHVEARMNANGELALVEVNARLAGGNIPLLVTAATGVDLIRCSLEASVGMPVDLKPTLRRAAAIAFLFAREEGELRGIAGMDESRRLPGVRLVRAYPRRSSTIRLKNDFRDRIAYVIAEHAEPERAFATAVEAASYLQPEIEP